MTKNEYLKYLRDQAYWINQLVDDIESGTDRENWCDWCVDLGEKPEFTEVKEDKQVA